MEELNGAGAVTRTYTYGLQRISEDQIVNSTWTPSFYGYDGGGNVRQLTNAAGAVTDTYEYDAFGNSFTTSGSTPNNYLYGGEQYDPDLGLYYLRARYYNPATGRFVSRDPEEGWLTNPMTLHRYLYASGDAINRVDPSGRSDAAEEDLIDKWVPLLIVTTAVAYGRNALAQLACDAIAWLEGGALAVTGYEDIAFNYATCSAKGRLRWTCLASGHYVQIGTGNTTLSPSFTGYGNSETQACQAAISAFQASAPRGFYTRHPRCTKCWQN
jgi:RHS repeat-associated protein